MLTQGRPEAALSRGSTIGQYPGSAGGGVVRVQYPWSARGGAVLVQYPEAALSCIPTFSIVFLLLYTF